VAQEVVETLVQLGKMVLPILVAEQVEVTLMELPKMVAQDT
jgi:hypothetical protein